MPWSVERAGSVVYVRIEVRITDWEDLFNAIQAELDGKVTRIVIPTELPGSSRTEANMLEMLHRLLIETGVPVVPPSK
jgi:hypothetical protein